MVVMVFVNVDYVSITVQDVFEFIGLQGNISQYLL